MYDGDNDIDGVGFADPGGRSACTIEAVEAEKENDDDTRTIGLPANEENSDDRAWNEVENHRDDSNGESDAERNA